MKTLEDFIQDQCGMVTPKLLELLESHREFVEHRLQGKDSCNLSHKAYMADIWFYLPDPKEKHFTP